MNDAKRILHVLMAAIAWAVSAPAWSELFQILHTNDIHAHLDHATHQPDLGGYGQLKVKIEQMKQWGKERGIPSLAMDAGDFMEGHIYYLADRGKKVYEVHGSVGFDVTVIGNHDYLMGAHDLNEILRDVNPDFEFLGANFHIDKKFTVTNEKMKPYWETVINGIKVGIIGITLKDMLYEWRIGEGHISDEVDAAKKYAKELRARGNDVVMALTHVGLGKDKKIAKAVPELDLIVGGHSHDAMFNVHYEKSKGGKRIPIVQAGKHAEWLGQLVLDFDKKTKKLRVNHYELLPVRAAYKDEHVEDIIARANDDLYDLFGADWLNEVVGYSSIRTPKMGGSPHVWLHMLNDSMKDAVDADFAVNVEALSGTNYPSTGPISRRDLYNSNPRTFEFDNKLGYNVYTARVRGVWISLVFRAVMRLGIPMYVSGIDFDYKPKGDGKWGEKYSVSNLRVQGKRINPFKLYKVALPEAIVRGGFAITKWVGLLLKFPDDYKISMWQALEQKIRSLGTVAEDYVDRYFFGKDGVLTKTDRVYLP
jgi:5'-nucleotidase/UDP-sugar diphosphatase